MKPRRVIAAVAGVIAGVVALGLIAGGGVLVWAYGTQRDANGFLLSPDYDLRSEGYALTSEAIDLNAVPEAGPWSPSGLATVRLEASGAGDVFLGIGPTADVDTYLDGVARGVVTDLGRRSGDVKIDDRTGTAPPEAPGGADFWAVQQSGGGSQQLTWDVETGDWTAVIMNADGSAGVDVLAQAGIKLGILGGLAIGLFVIGLLVAAMAAALLVFAFRKPGEPVAAAPSERLVAGRYPLALEGELDEPLNRWMWLVKWFLAIPHFFVLALLAVAATLLTILAWFSIVFTGRYPRSFFDFNVGVARWWWRVTFYCTSALGTDRYPPFTLDDDPSYPARLDVDYPERLSRGLPFVKWLLAIPHLIITGILASGAVWWTTSMGDNGSLRFGGGLISVLAVIAGFILLFTGAYPRSLFDLIVGLNRWVYRVFAYVGLMTDEYPPFRLDGGPTEPPADAPPTPDPG